MEYNREDQLETKNELIVSDQKPDQAIKKAEQQKRRLSWMTPILSGIIGGSLVLGVTTYQHSKDETANTSVQTQTNETSNSSASSTKANTEKLSSTNSSDISTMVENVSPAIVGISNYQKQTESGMFGFESNRTAQANKKQAQAQVSSIKKQTAKHTLLQITTLSKARLN